LLLQRKAVSGYIFDLRDNPGGLVKAGMDIARLLMDGTPTVFSIVGRADEPEQKVRSFVCCGVSWGAVAGLAL
jgi:C-terminal processing protease CtpA/Prc